MWCNERQTANRIYDIIGKYRGKKSVSLSEYERGECYIKMLLLLVRSLFNDAFPVTPII
jgi:hypothetical protein